MQISDRLCTLTTDPAAGWEILYRSRDMMAAGTPVTQLTIGEHDIRTDPAILDEMARSAAAGHTGYAAVPGTDALRAAIAQRVQRQTGVPTEAENILVTPGGQAALFAAHMATTNPGETTLFIDPYYATYPGAIRGAGSVPVAVQARAENAFQPCVRDLETPSQTAAALLINTPNNPTGVVYTAETLAAIGDLCQRRDLWLISDEVYDGQIWDGVHVSPRSLPGMMDRTLVVGSMSKSFAMTGSRLGWLVGPAKVIDTLINFATHTTYGVPGYIQDAAHWALTQGPELEHRICAPFARRREATLRMIAGQNVVRAVPAQGAMYVMLDIRATGLSGRDFADRLLHRHHIAVMPGESFGTAAAGHVRVAMTVEDEAYKAALQTLLPFAADVANGI